MTTQLALTPGAAEHWVQSLDPRLATQALIGFGLWSEDDGVSPSENLEMAYRLAERTLSLARQAISFHAEGTALVCQFVYAERAISASAQPQGEQKAESGKMKGQAMQSSDLGAPTYDSQLSAFSSQLSLALALTRAILRAAYDARLL